MLKIHLTFLVHPECESEMYVCSEHLTEMQNVDTVAVSLNEAGRERKTYD